MKYKNHQVDGHKVYYSSDWINDLEVEMHFNWYYHQAKLIYDHCERNKNILEIGVGSGLLADMLKKRGWKIQTLDIDEGKKPDFCCNALDFNYQKNNIETVLAFEIFEHIPFSTFEKVIKNVAESDVREIFFSLPWNEKKVFGVNIKIPKISEKIWELWLPKNIITTHAHFWEVGKITKDIDNKKIISIHDVMKVFNENGYRVNLKKRVGCIQYLHAEVELE